MTDITDYVLLRNLVDRYSTAVTMADFDAIAAVYAEDAEWIVDAPFNQVLRGRAAIVAGLRALLATQEFVIQMVHSAAITIEGDAARLHCVVEEIARGRDGTGVRVHGLYEDTATKRDGNWRFALRHFKPLLLDPTPPPGTSMAEPAAGD